MSDADDPVQRYLVLWTQYLTALLADPRAMETLKRWMSFTGQFAYPAPGEPQRQLGLFQAPPVPAADALRERLESLDLDRMTPLEALSKLAELKKEARL